MNAGDFINLIIETADSLRAVGVLQLSVDGCQVYLAPQVQVFPAVGGSSTEEEGVDPLNDPATFGQQGPDASAPGFTKEDTIDE